MGKKMIGSFYPYCSSKKTTYGKSQDISGIIYIEDDILKFDAKMLLCITLKSRSISIKTSDIDHIETMNLNGVFPFGVCIFLKDGSEYMFGHMNNKKLKAMIEENLK